MCSIIVLRVSTTIFTEKPVVDGLAIYKINQKTNAVTEADLTVNEKRLLKLVRYEESELNKDSLKTNNDSYVHYEKPRVSLTFDL